MNDNIRFKLLDDKTTDEDKFSHKKVADAIELLIRNTDEGKSIGLTGNWGSGKSSIISMINKNLKEKKENDNKEYKVFVFDAWAHEGDPLKRSFLEKIIDFLSKEKWLIDDKWVEEKKSELSRKIETNIVTNKKIPTKVAVYFTIATVIALLFKEFFSKWPLMEMWLLVLSIIFMVIPVIILIIAAIKYHSTKGKKKLDYISVFSDKGVEKIETKTFKTEEPTSIEFQERFKEIFEKIHNNNDKKLLIVIDNLDRIDEEDALKIWSTMKAFFDIKDLCEKWQKNLWLLVPFDRSALDRIWRNSDKKIDLPSSFTEKTFQIIFETPLPVTSDWEQYFKNQFKLAFENFTNEDLLDNIIKIYDIEARKNKLPPTPREIKIFINNLGSSFLKNKFEIDLRVQALYVILRKVNWKDDDTLIDELRQPNSPYITPEIISLFPLDFRRELAALFFGVDKKKAWQMVMYDAISDSLIKEDENEIVNYKDSPGFYTMLSKIIINKYKIGFDIQDKQQLLIVSKNLGSIYTNNNDDLGNYKFCFNHIKLQIYNITNWGMFNQTMANGLISLMNFYKNDLKYENILSSICNLEYLTDHSSSIDSGTIYSLKSDKETINVIKSLNSIISNLIQNEKEEYLEKYYLINLPDGSSYLNFLELLLNLKEIENYNKYYKPAIKASEVDKSLVNLIKTGNLIRIIHKDIIEFFIKINFTLNYKLVVNEAYNRFINLETDKKSEIQVILAIQIIIIRYNKITDVSISPIAKSGRIFHNYYSFKDNPDNTLFFPILFFIIRYNKDDNIDNNIGNANNGKREYDNLLRNPENYNDLVIKFFNFVISEKLVEKFIETEKESAKKIIGQFIKEISAKKDVIEIIPPNVLYKYEGKFYNNLEKSDYFNLIHKYDINILVDICKTTKFNYVSASFYKGIVDAPSYSDLNFNVYLSDNLDNLKKDIWLNEFSKDYYTIFDLLESLKNKMHLSNLKSFYSDAMLELIIKSQNDDKIFEKFKKRWETIKYSFSKDTLITFKKDLLDGLIKKSDDYIDKIIEIIGTDFFDCSILINNSDRFLRILMKNILKRNESESKEFNTIELSFAKIYLTKCKELKDVAATEYANIKDIVNKIDAEKLPENIKILISEIKERIK